MAKVLRRGLCFVGIGVALSLATSATVLADTFLPPSGTAPTPAETFLGTPLTVIDTPTISHTDIYGNLGSTLRVEVVRESGGTVEFLYEVVDSANRSTTGLASLTLTEDASANSTVDFATSDPSSLAASGPSIMFKSGMVAGALTALPAGATWNTMFIRTSATALKNLGSPQTSGEPIGLGTHVDLNGDEPAQGSFLMPGPTLLGLKALSLSAVTCFALVQRRRMAVSSF